MAKGLVSDISAVLLHPNCLAKSSTTNEVDTEKELLPYWSDCWNVLVHWSFQGYQPLHIVTKLFAA
jgi:hypothetical protein